MWLMSVDTNIRQVVAVVREGDARPRIVPKPGLCFVELL